MINKTKEKLLSSEVVLGTFISINSVELCQIFSRAGYDFLMIDYEHGIMDMATAGLQISVVRDTPTTPLLRIPWNDITYVKKGLDAGAFGLMYPMINNKEEAEKAVKLFHYPPRGIRGVGANRASMFNNETKEYLDFVEDQLLCIAQIETIEAIKNIDDILSVDGIEVAFIGPYDLSYSMGVNGQTNHQLIKDAMNKVLISCQKNNVAPGIMTSPEYLEDHIKMGFKFLIMGVDSMIINEATRENVNHFRQLLVKK